MADEILRREGENLLNEAGEVVARFEANNIIGNFGSIIYTLDESIIGKWINGENIYRRIIPYNSNLSTSKTEFAEDVSFMKQIISAKYVQEGTFPCIGTISLWNENDTWYYKAYDGTSVEAGAQIYIILEYLKN